MNKIVKLIRAERDRDETYARRRHVYESIQSVVRRSGWAYTPDTSQCAHAFDLLLGGTLLTPYHDLYRCRVCDCATYLPRWT